MPLQTHYLLSCATERDGSAAGAPPAECGWVEGARPDRLGLLLGLALEQGLDEEWCLDQLANGASCILALSRQGGQEQALGMGLVTFRPFWIEEIAHQFDPGPQGCYFFATYVRPAYRGRGIQKLLDGQRLARAAALGRRWAYAVVDTSNLPSCRSHRRSGFRPVLRIDHLRLGPCSLASRRRLSPSRPCGQLLAPQDNPRRTLLSLNDELYLFHS